VDSAALWTAFTRPQGLDNAARCPHGPQPRRRRGDLLDDNDPSFSVWGFQPNVNKHTVVRDHQTEQSTRSPGMILHINTEDVRVTEQIVEGGKLMGVDVLDHLIIGQQRYVSMKERQLGF